MSRHYMKIIFNFGKQFGNFSRSFARQNTDLVVRIFRISVFLCLKKLFTAFSMFAKHEKQRKSDSIFKEYVQSFHGIWTKHDILSVWWLKAARSIWDLTENDRVPQVGEHWRTNAYIVIFNLIIRAVNGFSFNGTFFLIVFLFRKIFLRGVAHGPKTQRLSNFNGSSRRTRC